jgi:hypothetical protein
MEFHPTFRDDDGQTVFPEGTLRARLVGADENSGPALRNFRRCAEEVLQAMVPIVLSMELANC